MSGVLSAFFVNDTICLVFTPIVLDVAFARRQRPLPYLLALATASNIGSSATITGNPQNILIGSVSGIAFRRFLQVLGPVAIVGLALDALLIWFVFRREFSVRHEPSATVASGSDPSRPAVEDADHHGRRPRRFSRGISR